MFSSEPAWRSRSRMSRRRLGDLPLFLLEAGQRVGALSASSRWISALLVSVCSRMTRQLGSRAVELGLDVGDPLRLFRRREKKPIGSPS